MRLFSTNSLEGVHVLHLEPGFYWGKRSTSKTLIPVFEVIMTWHLGAFTKVFDQIRTQGFQREILQVQAAHAGVLCFRENTG